MTEPYTSFEEIERREKRGVDYEIRARETESPVLVMSPHGGGIEPGVSEMVEAVSNGRFSYYLFEGLRRSGNYQLHIPSIQFDEPTGLRMVGNSEITLSIHGCTVNKRVAYCGGLDEWNRNRLAEAIQPLGIAVQTNEEGRFAGISTANICNLNRPNGGIQLELSEMLREELFLNLYDRAGRQVKTELFERLAESIRGVLRLALFELQHNQGI